MTNNQKEQIIRLRAAGHGYRIIAQQIGIPVSTVKSFCRRKNINADTAAKLAVKIPTETTHCVNCGCEIHQVPKQKRKKFCTDECRQAWWNNHLDQVNRKAYYTLTCRPCGKVFQVYGDRSRRYCSHECYIAARFQGGDSHE